MMRGQQKEWKKDEKEKWGMEEK